MERKEIKGAIFSKGLPWPTQRENLQRLLEKHPNLAFDVLDAAYLAGLEDNLTHV